MRVNVSLKLSLSKVDSPGDLRKQPGIVECSTSSTRAVLEEETTGGHSPVCQSEQRKNKPISAALKLILVDEGDPMVTEEKEIHEGESRRRKVDRRAHCCCCHAHAVPRHCPCPCPAVRDARPTY